MTEIRPKLPPIARQQNWDDTIDLSFFQTLRQRFKAPGDFAQAYVVAHEVGDHVRNLLGIMNKVRSRRQRMSERQYDRLSVRLELQADCCAGIRARQSQQANRLPAPGPKMEGSGSKGGDDNLDVLLKFATHNLQENQGMVGRLQEV